MHEHIPTSEVETAIHMENQAAAKDHEPRGFFEGLYDALGKIFDAGREVVQSVRHEADLMFWGRDTLPRQSEMHHSGNVEVSDGRQISFEDLMKHQAEMAPPAEPEMPASSGPDR